ncbi:MAG: hypothetical protein PHR77_02610 [Kiritimatiellae bacterium]|nr:hypothetical protein [Kiritimatiellia bacterium]MDD5523355.1 hypothetical protein [Kiritimatiellia bacterium]
MKKMLITVLWSLTLAGCLSIGWEKINTQVRLANRSGKSIHSVAIDSDGDKNVFGFLAATQRGDSTAGGCEFRFWKGFAIEWEENGEKRKVLVDIMRYKAKLDQIKSLGFYYLGNNQWQVIARDGERTNAKEIKP